MTWICIYLLYACACQAFSKYFLQILSFLSLKVFPLFLSCVPPGIPYTAFIFFRDNYIIFVFWGGAMLVKKTSSRWYNAPEKNSNLVVHPICQHRW